VRVLFLTHYFPPEVGAPQARLSALAGGLVGRGLGVTVHTCPPHYPDGVVKPPYENRLWHEARRDGVKVVRSAVAAFPNRGFGRRLLDHASFSLSSLALAHRAGGADVVVVESPPLFLAAAGVLYARRLGASLIVNVADLWPDTAVELGALESPAAIRAAKALERFAYRGAAALTTPTAGMANVLRERSRPPHGVHQVLPFVDRRRFEAIPEPAPGDGPLRVLYAGTVGLAQGIHTLIEAAELAGREAVQVTIAGSGAELDRVRELAARRAPANVKLLGAVPAERIPELYAGADAAVVLLRDRPVFASALPTKMFEAMAAGRALLLSASGEAAELVERLGCGVVVPPESPAALAKSFAWLHSEGRAQLVSMGAAGRAAAPQHDLDRAVYVWKGLLERIASQASASMPNSFGGH
jgi:glycosyltransferase involved in cell wall biosynthesis